MKTRNSSQSGFGVVEIVLVLVLVGILAFTGWYIWHAQQATNKYLTPVKTTEPKFKRRPKTGSTVQSKQTTQTTQPTTTAQSLYPADATTPAAGTCDTVSGTLVTITANPDIPSPRCAQVSLSQTLMITNNTSQSTDVTFATYQFSIAPGASHTIAATFGTYLQPGVHYLKFNNLYAGSNAEIWLK